uniref:Variant surface glycoprotein 1125.4329 n=1 Tax=Trypanosoma brucei TaxID=5691 RepID=A0A1J0RAF4_9TRYP|nr:variant surface glycoprotein 1125.4329 [Trypanosoma brucei]
MWIQRWTIITFLSTLNVAVQAEDPVSAKVVSLCDEEAYLTHFEAYLTGRLSGAIATANDLRNKQRQWTLAAATAETVNDRCAYGALAELANAKAEQAQTHLKDLAAKTVATARELNIQAGKAAYARRLAKLTFDGSGSHHNIPSSATTVNIRFVLRTSEPTSCEGLKDPTKIGVPTNSQAPTYEAATAIKVTPEDKLLSFVDKVKVTLSGLTTCSQAAAALPSYQTAAGSCSHDSGGTTTATIEKARTTYSTAADSIYEDASSRACKQPAQADNPTPAEQLTLAVCTALSQQQQPKEALENLDGNALQAEPVLVNYIGECVPEFHNTADVSSEQTQKRIKEYIKNAYQENNQKFTDKFVTSLTKSKPAARKGAKTETDKNVKQLASDPDGATAMGRAEGDRIKKKLEAEKKNKVTAAAIDTKTTEEKCKDKSIEECKEENGCEFKEGKCQVKMNTGTETNGKANTTGNNSFVIHKLTPLLAVLFLA